MGPIPIGAAAAPLRETLGPAEVHRVQDAADEGMGYTPGIEIFGASDRQRVRLRRDGNLVCGPANHKDCRWRIEGGLPFETTLEDLVARNGRPIVFNGCCWDAGGIVTSWEGGKLETLRGRIRIAVTCEGDVPDRMTGDVRVRSDDPEIQRRLKCNAAVIDF